MKKSRFISLLLGLALVFSLFTFSAQGYQSDLVDAMEVEARAVLLADPETDFVLYEQSAYAKAYPASITKVMTAVMVLEAIEAGELTLDQVITADQTAWTELDWTSSNQNIQAGEEMRVEDLLYCLMVASANESANILAVAVSGSIEAFMSEMNVRMKELGCTATNFVNPHGMPHDDHYTTAYDLYLIAKHALTFPLFREIVACDEYYVDATNLSGERHFFNTNGLLSGKKYSGYYYEYCTGIKTGTTEAAGYCLLSSAEKNGQTLVCVMLGCENPKDEDGNVKRYQFTETTRLFEWGFKNFSYHTILDATLPVAEVPVTLSTECDYVSVVVDGTLTAQLPNDITGDDFEWDIKLVETVEAPVKAGDKLGTLTVTLDGENYGTVDLVAVNDVARSEVLAIKNTAVNTVTSWPFIIFAILVAIVIIVLIIRSRIVAARRRRYTGRRGRD